MSADMTAITPEFPPKAAFRKWLRSLPAEKTVARRLGCMCCPLAAWMRLTTNFDAPYIRPDEAAIKSAWRPDFNTATAPLPEWANKFATSVDQFAIRKGHESNSYGPVTAADCLRVLARTPRA